VRLASMTMNVLLTSLLALGLCGAQPGQPERDPSRVRLIGETTGVEPGSTTHVALEFDMDPTWHIYWAGRNETGVEPRVRWSVPDGVTMGPIQWPAPERYVAPGDLLDHVYHERVALIVPVKIDERLSPGERVEIKGAVRWVVCSDVCLMDQEDVSLTVPVVEPGTAATSSEAPRFKAARALHPQPLKAGDPVRTSWDGDALVIAGEGVSEISFYPASDCVDLVDALEDGHAEGSELRLRVDGAEGSVEGVVRAKRSDGTIKVYRISEPVAF